jgi:hypothetical protein
MSLKSPGGIRTCAWGPATSAVGEEAGYRLRNGRKLVLPLLCPCLPALNGLLQRPTPRCHVGTYTVRLHTPPMAARPTHHCRPSRAICATSQLRPT